MAIKDVIGKVGFTLKKKSPEILVGVSAIGVVTTAVLAGKATLRLPTIIDEWKDVQQKSEMALANEDIPYTEEDALHDRVLTTTQMAIKIGKLYLPTVISGAITIGCLLESHKILRERALAIGVAYATLDQSYRTYRERVADKYGVEEELEIRHNVKTETVTETITDDKGKKKKVKKEQKYVDDAGYSAYATFFEESNPHYDKDPEYNLQFIRNVQNQCNDLLRARGHVFLNEVYDRLGLPRTKAGQVVGWISDYSEEATGDNYIDFGLFNTQRPKAMDFVNGYESVILLDFNVDGNIWDDEFVNIKQ